MSRASISEMPSVSKCIAGSMYAQEDKRYEVRPCCLLIHRYSLRFSRGLHPSRPSPQSRAWTIEEFGRPLPTLDGLFPIFGFRLSSVPPVAGTSFISLCAEDASC
jgi:hypothetical protein